MSKSDSSRTIFVCQQCGKEELKWLGRCPNCQEWNSFIEQAVSAPVKSRSSTSSVAPPQELSGISVEAADRSPLPIPEFNRVIGGGIVPGSLMLTGGDPGIGK